MGNSRILKVLAGALALAACGGNAANADELSVTIEQAAIPSHYSAPLPASSKAMSDWFDGSAAFPPLAHSVDMILAADDDFWARLAKAGGQVAAADRQEWIGRWHGEFEYETPEAAFCDKARAVIDAPPAILREVLVMPFAADCATDQDRAAILRADTPPRAVLAYYDKRFWRRAAMPAFDPRLAEVVRQAIAQGPAYQARRAAFILIQQGDPRAEAALLSIIDRMPAAERRDEVSMALFYGKTDRALRLARAVCARSDDPMCSSSLEDPAELAMQNASPPIDRDKARAAIAAMVAAGFEEVGSLDPSAVASTAPQFLLAESGQAIGFDVETGIFPNYHDRLMRDLWVLAGGSLGEAVFEEIPPRMDADGEEHGPYVLRVYANGTRFGIEARNLGDWYDMEAVLKLLNTVLEARKMPKRLVPLTTGDQIMIVVAATPKAIANAVERGLLEIGNPGSAEAVGKDYERQVLEGLGIETEQD